MKVEKVRPMSEKEKRSLIKMSQEELPSPFGLPAGEIDILRSCRYSYAQGVARSKGEFSIRDFSLKLLR